MTDIKVILDTGPLTDIGTLSQEERELLFDQIAADNPSIPRVIIDGFAEMQAENAMENIRLNKPNLKELLLRKIIHLAQNYGSDFNTIVIPIIPSFISGHAPKRSTTGDISDEKTERNKSHQGRTLRGGAIPQIRRMRPQEVVKKEEIPSAIKIRFDTQIFTTTINGTDYIAPPGEELDVIGLIINPVCQQPQIITTSGEFKDLSAVEISQPKIGDRLLIGRYIYPQASRACDDYFIKPDYALTIAGENNHKPFQVLFTDLDETKILRTFGAIFDYLSDIESYHQSEPAAQFVHTQLDLAIDGNKTAGLRENLLKKFNIKEFPEISVLSKEPARDPILDVLETVHYGRFNTVYNLSVLADIDMRGFSRIYQKSRLKGKDDKDVIAGINMHKERKAQIAFQNANRMRILDERNKLNTYLSIIEKKLGGQRLAEIEQQLLIKPALMIAAKNILELLKPAERKPIEIEFERHQKYLEAVVNNKCPHVKLYRTFRLAKDEERERKAFMELKKFFKNPTESNSMITCNNCGFDIMCPHIRDFTEMDLAGKFHTEIKAKLTKYIDKSVVKDQYYCRICGEMISSLEAFGDIGGTRDPSSTMNEELKNFMWGEIAILSKYLKFGNLVNVPQLISNARDTCYPFIFEIEKQILKSKTNSAEEIKAKKRLYVTIYAFAYFVHLILSNKSRAGENDISFKNFHPKNPKSAIVDMIRHSLESIVMSRNVVIREIPGMSQDIIKNTLIEAYKSMQSAGTQVMVYSGEAEDLLTTLILDPVYRYYYTISTIDDIIHGKKAPGAGKKMDAVDHIDAIMGDPIAKLEKLGKDKDIYGNARVPKFDKWDLKSFDNLAPLTNGKLTLDGKISGKLIYDDAFPGYTARSFEMFAKKQKTRIYTEPLYVDVSASGKGDPNAPMEVKFRPPHEKQREEFLELESIETKLLQYKTFGSVQNYNFLQAKKNRRWLDPNASLSRIYDEDGNAHAWTIYITEKTLDGKLERKEYKNNDVAALVESGTRFDEKITDRKCSICGVLWSTVDKLSEAKIRDSLHARQMVSNFFRFYENRCPKAGLHDFDEKGVCTKCAMSNSFLTANTSPSALSYYREYKDIYEKERAEFASAEATVEISVAESSKKTRTDEQNNYEEEYAKWTPNFNVVLDLANKLKINQRLLSALGAVEKQEYSDVQSGAYIPPEIDERNATRIFVVNTHVKNLITEYNQVRFFHRLVKPPIDLSTLIDSSGINKHKIAELSKKLPEVFNNYNARFTYIQRVKKPREIVAFCIQSFCEICLHIWNDADKDTEKLRHNFVAYIVKKILRAEELLTKPGQFNWSLLYGDKEGKATKEYDSNVSRSLQDDISQETDKEFEETEKEGDDFGDTGAPMADTFDMEEDPDRDEMDDGDSSNQIRVGEDLGLT